MAVGDRRQKERGPRLGPYLFGVLTRQLSLPQNLNMGMPQAQRPCLTVPKRTGLRMTPAVDLKEAHFP